jgi:hypothetical protein
MRLDQQAFQGRPRIHLHDWPINTLSLQLRAIWDPLYLSRFRTLASRATLRGVIIQSYYSVFMRSILNFN